MSLQEKIENGIPSPPRVIDQVSLDEIKRDKEQREATYKRFRDRMYQLGVPQLFEEIRETWGDGATVTFEDTSTSLNNYHTVPTERLTVRTPTWPRLRKGYYESYEANNDRYEPATIRSTYKIIQFETVDYDSFYKGSILDTIDARDTVFEIHKGIIETKESAADIDIYKSKVLNIILNKIRSWGEDYYTPNRIQNIIEKDRKEILEAIRTGELNIEQFSGCSDKEILSIIAEAKDKKIIPEPQPSQPPTSTTPSKQGFFGKLFGN